MIHPSLLPRLEQIGKSYEQEHKEAMNLKKEILLFFDYSQSTMKKLMAQNDRLLVNLKGISASDRLLHKDIQLSDQLAEMTRAYMPHFKELIAGKSLLDKVFAFEKRLVKDMQRLNDLNELQEQSEHIVQALEEEHHTIRPLLDKLKQRVAHCKKLLNELNSFSQYQLN